MERNINMGIVAPTALAPLIVGFVWYNPKVFGNAWMKASDMTLEKSKGANMAVVLGFTLLFSSMAAFVLSSIVVHQGGVFSLLQSEGGVAIAGAEEDFKPRICIAIRYEVLNPKDSKCSRKIFI